MKQLENSVMVTYGSGIDAHLYLQKFISLTINLDTPSEYAHESAIYKYLNYLKSSMGFRAEDQETLRYTSELIAEFSRYRDFKLRTLERIMSALAITLAYTAKNYMRIPPIVAGLCIMKIVAPDLYIKAQQGTLTYDEAVAFFDLGKLATDEDDKWPSTYFVKWWRYALDPNAEQELITSLNSTMFNYSLRSRTKLVQVTTNQIIDRFTQPA